MSSSHCLPSLDQETLEGRRALVRLLAHAPVKGRHRPVPGISGEPRLQVAFPEGWPDIVPHLSGRQVIVEVEIEIDLGIAVRPQFARRPEVTNIVLRTAPLAELLLLLRHQGRDDVGRTTDLREGQLQAGAGRLLGLDENQPTVMGQDHGRLLPGRDGEGRLRASVMALQNS